MHQFRKFKIHHLSTTLKFLTVLDTISVDGGNGDVIIKAQRGFCAEKCTCVRIVEFLPFEFIPPSPEDIAKEKQEKEQRHQKWRAIVAKEKENLRR